MGTKINIWVDGIKEADGYFHEVASTGAWSNISAIHNLDVDTEYTEDWNESNARYEGHDVVNVRLKRRESKPSDPRDVVVAQLNFCIRTIYETLHANNFEDGDEIPCIRWALGILREKVRMLKPAVEEENDDVSERS